MANMYGRTYVGKRERTLSLLSCLSTRPTQLQCVLLKGNRKTLKWEVINILQYYMYVVVAI